MRILFFVALVNTLIKLSCESFVFPAANTASNRILGFILAYNMDHIDPLLLIFNEYLAMCESGWKPTLVIFTTMPWGDPIRRYIKTKTFCYSINASYPISFSVHAPIISTGLGAVHRQVLGEEVHNYDMFVYHEDDIVFKHAHLIAYIEETKKIHTLFPENGLWDYNIGFQRYRKLFRGGDVHAGNFGEADILEQELLEEVPNFVPICLADHPYIKVDGNTHQAIWALTRDQVLLLQQKCSFMNQSSPSRCMPSQPFDLSCVAAMYLFLASLRFFCAIADLVSHIHFFHVHFSHIHFSHVHGTAGNT